MKCTQFEEQLSSYIDGELAAEERTHLEAHLAQCGSCRHALARIRHTAGLVQSLGEVPAPAELRARVFAQVGVAAPVAAMACAANYAWANRQCITHWTRQTLSKIFGIDPSELRLIYDIAHNIAKIEKHKVGGKELLLCVHRKGATRAFPAGHPDVPAAYRDTGQPVLIPGDMGRYSYVAVGTEKAMEETFGSTCHGAGRVRSRSAAKRELSASDVADQLTKKGITFKVASRSALVEEASEAYKDVTEVVDVADGAGISRKVLKARPIGVIKG